MKSQYFDEAFEQARLARERGETPVGAIIVHQGRIIARGGNRTREWHDPTAHAEIVVIRDACAALQSERLIECDLYVTLEPCTLCAAAISFARIRRLYFGATDSKGGAVESGVGFFECKTCHHAPEVYGGFREAESATLLGNFFKEKRK
jgi:tRNA(adenine34) deaminase